MKRVVMGPGGWRNATAKEARARYVGYFEGRVEDDARKSK